MKRVVFIFCLLAFNAMSLSSQQSGFPKLSGPYLGQKPPGMTPEIFAPGIVSTAGHEFGSSFSPDGREFYFTRYVPNSNRATAIYVMKNDGKAWTKPEIVPFSGTYYDAESMIAPDGKSLYFISSRFGGDMRKIKIWKTTRTNGGWSEPVAIGPPLSSNGKMAPCVAANGNLYYTEVESDDRAQLFWARWNGAGYDPPDRLGPEINLTNNNAHPFVPPDESLLLFDAQPRNPSSYDSYLYVSFRKPGGGWTEAKRLPESINSGNDNICASLSPDGKYLFFSKNMDIYWVDAKILEALRLKE